MADNGASPATTLFPQITHPKKLAFLTVYAQFGQIQRSCRAVDLDHSQHYYWLRTDPVYQEAFARAKELAAETLVEEAIRRARDGVMRTVYHQGEAVGEQLVYSDVLLIFLIKGMLPQYRATQDRDRTNDISELLKAVLLEMRDREDTRNVTPDAAWEPLPPTFSGSLPPPPDPAEA